ncbi:uncharacterized protein LOC100207676 isoform X1 [Hydra vulgaris]|uniref:Nematoblast specific protein n=1 Tax=Hydra vulgaris TaxID=6087 RepID=A7LH34_HYDVU|nr:uncharacterized protein LOC100207676 isoform X1 [Hydra vulgaris]XP_047129110.1 uncharacterized protein LOC100207676 isoform X2 [Hydra vulgaris]XP_047129111.1 uncharacterized protein LOC100207676 isoform X3 [Hydra vulgaris]ABS57275.1 nematoblast specific protein [Hydra vulgaris]
MSDPKVTVPMQGNAWCNKGGSITQNGLDDWTAPDAVCKAYVYISKSGSLKVSIKMNATGKSTIKITILQKSLEVKVDPNNISKEFYVGEWTNIPIGYLTIQIQGVKKATDNFGVLSSLVLTGSSISTQDTLFVKDNVDEMFHFGRRGPSVHLGFETSKTDVEWFYSEVTVPTGYDVIGSYFMVNGFSEGYFGMQVNSETERRVLFSVWSPFTTDDPSKIPKDQKILTIKKGKNVTIGQFGNEGSGGQSYLVYPWKANQTYKFLLGAKPQKSTNTTIFTAYFKDDSVKPDKWNLIASFQRPKLATYLNGNYSFLENFEPDQGDKTRMAYYDNQWVCDSKGSWTEITEATLTADTTARKKYRVDYSGGIVNNKFFMKNCGFFCDNTKLDTKLKRPPKGKAPAIVFKDLE